MEECNICYTEKEIFIMLPCNHELCDACFKSWIVRNQSCPFCRKEITGLKEMLYDILNSNNINNNSSVNNQNNNHNFNNNNPNNDYSYIDSESYDNIMGNLNPSENNNQIVQNRQNTINNNVIININENENERRVLIPLHELRDIGEICAYGIFFIIVMSCIVILFLI